MHMADALLSPIVGGTMTVVSTLAMGYSVKKISGDNFDEKKIPMMGVMGAFVFAAQMINFTIPGTGSSGHISGGILLAALLGPFPALITLASVLLIQCLFFADGGLLAYGCNVFNMGVCVCLIAFSCIYKPIVGTKINRRGITIASLISAVVGLQIGSFCVVLETVLSGVAQLPFAAFASLMQPIHLAIGLIEGFITATVLCFVHTARPGLLENAIVKKNAATSVSMKGIILSFVIITLVVGSGLSLFASTKPDGLEWSIEKVAGTTQLQGENPIHDMINNISEQTAIMPDYTFMDEEESQLGTAAAGMIGSGITIGLIGGIGVCIHIIKRKKYR